MNEYGQRSYIPINFAFAESILIMVGLFINLLVSSVRFYDPSIILSKPLILNGIKDFDYGLDKTVLYQIRF